MPGWSYNMKGHSHRGYICHLKRCKVPVSEIENMNLVKMVNETFHMIWGGEEIHCINWVEIFVHCC